MTRFSQLFVKNISFVCEITEHYIKMSPLAAELFRELQGRVYVGFWIGTRRWKALMPNIKMVLGGFLDF